MPESMNPRNWGQSNESIYDMYPVSLRVGDTPEYSQAIREAESTDQPDEVRRTLLTERGAAGLGHDYETDFDTTAGGNSIALQIARAAVQKSFRS